MTEKVKAWHFLSANKRLRYADNREVEVGETYSCEGKPVLCRHGMHGSIRAIDALRYAPGLVCCRVEIWGDLQHGVGKLCGKHRKVLAMADATAVILEWARWCALQVVHLWNCPEAMKKFLRTGDNAQAAHKALAAKTAASAAARAAARAAEAAARAIWAAEAAARALLAAVRAAEATGTDTGLDKLNSEIEKRLEKLLKEIKS